jgi:two-component system sensor histidine kinase AlgZ
MHPILADWRRLQLQLAASGVLGAVLGLLVRVVIGAEWLDALVFALPLAIVATPLSFSAWYLCRALPLSRTPPIRLVTAALGSGVVSGAVWAAIGYAWWDALVREGWARTDAPTPVLAALLSGLGGLGYVLSVAVHYLFQAAEDSADAGRRVLASEIAHREAELRALRAQVDPHFLFNSLNSIAGLTTADPVRAREMCQRLADFLRESLAVGASSRIPLRREVALAEQYLLVEGVRFGRRLSVRASVTPETADVAVPPLILQPLVENAVRHGVATCVEGGTIEIATCRTGDRVVIDVANPRDADGGRPGTGLGLALVRRRLGASFGGAAALRVEPSPAAYRVSVTIPIDEGSARGCREDSESASAGAARAAAVSPGVGGGAPTPARDAGPREQ